MANETTAILRFQIKEEVTGQMKKAREEMEKLQKTSDKTKGFVKDLFREFAGPVAAAGVASAIGALVKGAIDAAAGLQGLERRAQSVFGQSFPKMQAETQGLASQLHRSASDVLEFSTGFATLAQGLGIGTKVTNEMSTSLARLTVDFGSYFDIADQEAFDVIQSGLRGNTRALGAYGIILKDETLQEFAASRGIKQKVSTLNEAQALYLRYQFLLEKTNRLQGDAARNTETLGNKVKEFKSAWHDMLEEMGKDFLPAVTKLFGGLTYVLDASRASIGGFIQDWKAMGEIIGVGIHILGNQASVLPEFRASMRPDSDAPKGLGTLNLNDPGLDPTLGKGAEKTKESVAALNKEMKETVNELGKIGGGGGGGGGAQKATDKLKQMKETMDDLGKSYADARKDISRDLKQMENDHKEKVGSILEQIQRVKDDLKDLEKTYNKTLASFQEDKADAVGKQMQKVGDLGDKIKDAKERLADLELKAYREDKQGSVQVETTADIERVKADIADLEKQLQREQSVLSNFRTANPTVAARADELGGKTEFERETEKIDQRIRDENDAYNDRKKKQEDEMAKLNEKKGLEERVYGALRQEYASTTAALNAYYIDYTEKMQDLRSVTEETAKAMRQSLEDIRNSVSRVDAETQAASDFGKRVAARRDARVEGKASGGWAGGLTLVGEEGPELLQLPSGSYVHNNKDSQKMMGGVTITIQAMYISKEADVDDVLRRITRQIQKQSLQAA